MNIEVNDIPGSKFRISMDDVTGSISELEYTDLSSRSTYLIRKYTDFPSATWKAVRLKKLTAEMKLGEVSSIPVISRFISDLRFDEANNEVTFANKGLSKRWIFRGDGSFEFYSANKQVRRPS